MPRILIVEDSHVQALLLTRELGGEGFEVSLAQDGREAVEKSHAEAPDLVVLDLNLPLKDGFEVCRELRAGRGTRTIPIIMATAKAEETDQLIGFAMGADDYLIKPYSTRVLIARIRAILDRRRRAKAAQTEDTLESQGVVVDRYRHKAFLNGRELSLTPTEFRLLETLVRSPGRAFSRGELVEAIAGLNAEILEETINAYVQVLRRKLEDAGGRLIETVRGIGYRFRHPGDG